MLAEQRTDGQQASGRAYVTPAEQARTGGNYYWACVRYRPRKLTVTELNVPSLSGLSFRQAVLGDGDSVYATVATAIGPKLSRTRQ
ncbi:hypothetical protein IPL68_01080 [Candidatus Saccharibacteria bacterium]|nr:MAG: hypothetical protein IPL68_01080 [Candidatus Saccharibacteria bacterium]